MAESMPFAKPPEPLEISMGNPAHSWGKWKQKFEIYLKAIGASKKPDEMKVGLLLNHIGEPCLEIYSNFTYLPERDDPAGGEEKLPAEDSDNYATVVAKFDEYFQKRDPQLMLREKFWLHLKREPTQTFDSWVVTVKERAAECKFPADFYEQAVRDKLTFSCKEDNYKLKLYDEGAALSLEKAVKILSLKEATKRELHESKTAEIESVTPRGNRQDPHAGQDTEQRNQRDFKRKPFQTSGRNCGYCNRRHPPGKKNCPAADTRCSKCNKMGHFPIICKSVPPRTVNEVLETEDNFSLTFVGGVYTPTSPNTSKAEPAINSQTSRSDPGWHVNLKIQDQETLAWCIDTGAQVSVMPEHIYKSSYGTLSKSDRELVGAGDVPLKTLGCAVMNLQQDETVIKERVYVVSGASKLLLGIPAIRSLGLIHEIPGTYSVKAVHQMPDSHPLQSGTKEDIVKQYPSLFQGLGKLEGEHTIQLKEGATPFCLTTPRRVPLPLMKQVQEEIKRMEQLDVIEPVDEPTEWCSPIVVVPKADGRVRICVDLTRLNQAVRREVYQMPTVEETLGSLTEGSVFSKLDANSGFHQIVLNPESAKLTTFITPFGRYMFKRLPFGISSAPEHFQKRMDKELSGIEGVKCRMDDILIIGKDQAEHDKRLKQVLDRLVERKLTLNLEKCLFSQSRLQYLGQIIDSDGIRKDPSKIKAITDMAEPQNIADLRRFLGLVNHLMKFCPNLAETTKPLRDLLKKENAWVWGTAQQEAFRQLKVDMASDQVLALYDPEKETVVSSDASSFGLGAVLVQKQPSGEMRPVAYASRSMTETERRYAQIEKEALAITWALEHWAEFLIGMRFKVETDHKPLIPLFSTKLIDELPVRIQRFRMRLMRFDFAIAHVPGKLLYTADSLSRSPQEGKAQEPKSWDDLHDEVECYVNAVLVTLPASDQRLDEIRSELKSDDTLKTVMQYVQNGWPEEKRRVHGPIAKYWSERGNISLHDGLLLRGRRIIIPPRLRADVLRRLHDGHQGITKTRANAASSVWWPGISQDITRVVQNCAMCEKYRRERIEPMKGTEFPERPWSRVGVDFFQHKDKHYLLAVDYFSRDVEISQVSKNVNSAQTILQLKKIFSRHGIPDILFSDNGPQFDSHEFTNFSTDWQFQHITSSPRYPQSNGEVERAVQTMKAVLNKSNDEYLALLNYRDTPLHHGYSPAQLSMGRKLRTRVPCHPEELKPETPDRDHIRRKEKEYRAKMKFDYDHRHKVVEGKELSPGDRIWIPDLKEEGTVIKPHESPRSVIIQTQNGQVRRNRRMTRRVLVGSSPVPPQNEDYENHEPIPTRERNPDVSSAPGASQEDYVELPVPGDQPAVDKPLQPEPMLTRLRPRGALRRPDRLIEQC